MIDGLAGSTNHPFAADVLQQLHTLIDRLADVERRALIWRAQHDTVWQDVREQRTMGQARDLITGLRGAVQTLEGQQRLKEAMDLKRWRESSGDEAGRLAQAILANRDRTQNGSAGDLERELAEVERLIELLGGEDRPDNLPNLKDNDPTPALDRLRHDFDELAASPPESGVLPRQAIEKLTAAVFGQGHTNDPAHQTIRPGTGGLYTLRQDILRLRSEHEKISRERSTLSHEIDVAVAAIMFSARAQSELLVRQAAPASTRRK